MLGFLISPHAFSVTMLPPYLNYLDGHNLIIQFLKIKELFLAEVRWKNDQEREVSLAMLLALKTEESMSQEIQEAGQGKDSDSALGLPDNNAALLTPLFSPSDTCTKLLTYRTIR